jgi:hypothetical protein
MIPLPRILYELVPLFWRHLYFAAPVGFYVY